MERVKSIPHSPRPDHQMHVRKIDHGSQERAATHYAVRGAWICHTGKLRRMNEDACLAGAALSGTSTDAPAPFTITSHPWIVAVSDGIGGHRAGAEASREVVEALAGCKRVTPHGVADTLQRVNRRLCERGVFKVLSFPIADARDWQNWGVTCRCRAKHRRSTLRLVISAIAAPRSHSKDTLSRAAGRGQPVHAGCASSSRRTACNVRRDALGMQACVGSSYWDINVSNIDFASFAPLRWE